MSTSRACVVNALARHLGREQGISAAALAAELGLRPRRLRHLISELRDDGFAICGHPSTGYFMAVRADELAACTAFLQRRALHSLRLLCRMRHVSMPELLGQLKLNQA